MKRESSGRGGAISIDLVPHSSISGLIDFWKIKKISVSNFIFWTPVASKCRQRSGKVCHTLAYRACSLVCRYIHIPTFIRKPPGIFLPSDPDNLAHPFTSSLPSQSQVAPNLFAMIVVVAFSSCLDVAAIEMEMGTPLDFNGELQTASYFCVFSRFGTLGSLGGLVE